MSKSVLVTGGAGFIGGHLSRVFRDEGYSVIAIDDLSNGSIENLVDGVKFIKVDISTNEIFEELKDYTFDVVIHCAAQTSNALSFKFSNILVIFFPPLKFFNLNSFSFLLFTLTTHF